MRKAVSPHVRSQCDWSCRRQDYWRGSQLKYATAVAEDPRRKDRWEAVWHLLLAKETSRRCCLPEATVIVAIAWSCCLQFAPVLFDQVAIMPVRGCLVATEAGVFDSSVRSQSKS